MQTKGKLGYNPRLDLNLEQKETMVEADPWEMKSRDQIRDDLIALAERHVAARGTYKTLKIDESKDMTVWQGDESGVALTVCTMKGEGLEMADFLAFQDPASFPANMSVLDSILTCRKLDDDMGENCYAMYQHIKTPIMVSNRCCFNAVYNHKVDENTLIHITTSKGMRAIEEKPENITLRGKDVLSHTTVTYNKIEACDGGVRITSVLCVDPAGSLPDFVKNKIAA